MSCKYCNKPRWQCEEQDLLFIQPFNKRFKSCFIQDPDEMFRYDKVVTSIVGANDKKNKTMYRLRIVKNDPETSDNRITLRQYLDIALTLRMCVWDGDERVLKGFQKSLTKLNIDPLPIEAEYITILKNGI